MRLKNLNIADYFSVYRLVAAPALILAIAYQQRNLTAILLLVSFITDAVDGYIARKKHIESSGGGKLDSIGDLVTLILGLAAFISFETQYFLDHLPIIVVTFSLFIIQMIIALVRFKKISSYHTYLAKVTAVLMAMFLISTPVIGPVDIVFYTTFYAGIAEAVEEIIITFVLNKPEENVKGLYWILKKQNAGLKTSRLKRG
jgi:phosphatidylglycerophosphate synthase